MSETVSRIKSICDEFDGRVETVGAYHARAEIAKALADIETLLIERGEQCANLRAENVRLVAELEAARIIIIDMVHEANLQDAFDDDSGCAIMEQAKDFLALSEKYLP